jgi:sugar-specific transcriptional regulator TrmB
MAIIPPALTTSLNTLGLTKYEARVYATLILYDNAEAKDISEFLSLTKPSVYDALDGLAERGLVVKRSSKPASYSAISPEIALNMLMGDHERALEQALSELKELEKEKVISDTEDAIWAIYGDANIKYKMRDLFSKAKKHINCILGERYISFLENINIQDISLRLIVLSDSPGIEDKIHALFPGERAEIHIVSSERYNTPPPFLSQEFAEAQKYMNFENVLEMNVDNEELLVIPPFHHGSGSMLNTRNKAALYYLETLGQVYRDWFIEGDKSQHTSPPI